MHGLLSQWDLSLGTAKSRGDRFNRSPLDRNHSELDDPALRAALEIDYVNRNCIPIGFHLVSKKL